MRKKIILGIVILAAIVGGIVYFNMNYAVVDSWFGRKEIANTNVTKLMHQYHESEWEDWVYCTPSLKKFNGLKSLLLMVNEDTNFEYLSEMNALQELEIFYSHSYCGRLETLPELPNLKRLFLLGGVKGENNFTLSEEYKYNFSSIEILEISFFTTIDCEALKHFENLSTLKIYSLKNDLMEEEIEELQSRGITVEYKRRSA